jgi:hypothetical protein
MSHMIVLFEETNHNSNKDSKHNKDNQSNHSKDDITPVTKAVARKSILMQIPKARAANGFHWTKIQGCHTNVNNN